MKELLQPCIDAKSAVHKHYLGQAMPDAVYQLFALVRDGVIPALAQQKQPTQEPEAAIVEVRRTDGPWQRYNIYGSVKLAEDTERRCEGDGIEIRVVPLYRTPPTQPAQKPDLWKTQFLTDVMTSAGLLRYGRTDKKLAQRIADGSARWRTELYASAPTQPALSSADIAHIFQRIYPEKLPESDLRFLDFGRAIEAHCRGGADK